MLDDGEKTYSYDIENRLIEVQDKASESTLIQFQYDALGRRVAKKIYQDGLLEIPKINYFYYSKQWQVLEERVQVRESGELGKEKIANQFVDGVGIDSHCEMKTFDSLGNVLKSYYYLQNHRWDVVGLTDTNGQLIEAIHYEPYGSAYKEEGGTFVSFEDWEFFKYGFQGRRSDTETGLMYFRHRYYSVRMGRFITHDPLGYDGGGKGLYGAFGGNPINSIDPYGLKPSKEVVVEAIEQYTNEVRPTVHSYLNKLVGSQSILHIDSSVIEQGVNNIKLLVNYETPYATIRRIDDILAKEKAGGFWNDSARLLVMPIHLSKFNDLNGWEKRGLFHEVLHSYFARKYPKLYGVNVPISPWSWRNVEEHAVINHLTDILSIPEKAIQIRKNRKLIFDNSAFQRANKGHQKSCKVVLEVLNNHSQLQKEAFNIIQDIENVLEGDYDSLIQREFQETKKLLRRNNVTSTKILDQMILSYKDKKNEMFSNMKSMFYGMGYRIDKAKLNRYKKYVLGRIEETKKLQKHYNEKCCK